MATNRDLLKEAIADAKSVKETAIANAKLALEEAFTPHLKSMLAAKLEEMDASSFERKNSPAGDSLKDLAPKKVGQSTVQEEKEEMDEEIDLDELLAELEESKDEIDEAKKEEIDEEMKDKDDVKEEMKDKDEVKEDARTDAEEEGYKDGMKDEKEDMEDEEIDLEDMSEDDLKGFIEDVIKDMVADGEIEPGDEFVEDEVEVEDVEDIDVVDDLSVDVEIDEAKKEEMDESEKVDEAKDEIDEASRVKGEKGVGNEDGDKDDSKIEKETEKMRFKEAMDEIQALKVELNEVNLLNAKLLYTNKIFKAKNLTESKKVKVLKAFDKAKDVQAAKTIFETLSEGLLDKSPVNESRNLGSASKASGLEPKATSTKQPIIESNDVYNRMRKLAGLI